MLVYDYKIAKIGDFYREEWSGEVYIRIREGVDMHPGNCDDWQLLVPGVKGSQEVYRADQMQLQIHELTQQNRLLRTQMNMILCDVALLNEKIKKAVFCENAEMEGGERRIGL